MNQYTGGFVDVSNMSDLEIKRLGQADDYDDPRDNPYAHRNLSKRNPYGYNNARRPARVTIKYPTAMVFAASSAAFRINGEYIKAEHFWPEGSVKKPANRDIMMQLLESPDSITAEDHEQGALVREYFQALTFKIIQGRTLNQFENSQLTAASGDEVTDRMTLGLIASMSASHQRGVARDETNQKIILARGGYLGAVGDKVTAECTVARCNYSQKWNIYFVTAITADSQPVGFTQKNPLEVNRCVKVTGTIKSTVDGQTRLTRVKLI